MANEFLDAAKRILEYDPDSGLFFWLVSRGRQASGSIAGTKKDGYVCINMLGKFVRAQRLAWLFMTGDWPPDGISVDHRNRQRSDNRWSNLRLASGADNSANASIRPDNTTGHPGVHLFKRTGRYSAYIQRHGKMHHLGYYATKAEAIAVRKAATEKIFGAFAPNHGEPSMVMIRNLAPGPRGFNLKDGAQQTLMPGEAADLDLAQPLDDDKIMQAWLKSKPPQIEVLEGGSPESTAYDAGAFAEVSAQIAELTAKQASMLELKQAAEMDTARLTPPRQFAGDGGPDQVPTIGNTGGALTPSQEEKGRAEPPTGAGSRVSATVGPLRNAPPAAPQQAPPPRPASSKE